MGFKHSNANNIVKQIFNCFLYQNTLNVQTYSSLQSAMYLQVKCVSVERQFRYFIFFTCLGIVTWQCWKCCTKFQSKPQGTKLSIVNSAGNMFPSVTFCPYPDPNKNTIYNSTILLDCGITRSQYFVVWSNKTIESCRNPKTLYYNIIWKLDELISKVKIYSFNMSNIVFKDNKNS